MAEYTYKAAQLDGKIISGIGNAASEDILRDNLQLKGLYLLEIKEQRKQRGRRMKANQLSDFCRELSSMLGTGVSLVRAMNIIVSRDIDPKIKRVFNELNQQIKKGTALSAAMSMQGRVFPDMLINMVKAGEANGRLDNSLSKMAIHFEKEHRLNSDVKNAMTYPLILIVLTLGVIVGIFTLIFPRFMPLFEGMTLPPITEFMMALSNLFTQQWYIVIAVVALLIGLVIWIKAQDWFKLAWDKFKLRIPRIGKLIKIIYTARFARTLSTLYSSGLSILNALQIARNTIGNRYIENQFGNVIKSIKEGISLSDALSEVEGFDKKLCQTIAVGEETGKLDDLLESVSDSFDYESTMAVNKLIKLIEPIMILIMAVIVVIVMLSVLLPIYDMYGNIDTTTKM